MGGMDRFTRSKDGKFALIDWEGKVRLDEEQAEILTNALARLASYEDTGLMPDEIAALKADRDAWRRRAECMESDLIKTLRAIPVGMCKQFCKRYRANCGVWGECNPEWRGPEEDNE